MMEQLFAGQKDLGILIIGGDSSLQYLLQRYAERIGYTVSVANSPYETESIRQFKPAAVIFPSVEILAGAQGFASELTNCDIPIIVCSSVLDQVKTRELGADYCLLHPLEFEDFSSILMAIGSSQ